MTKATTRATTRATNRVNAKKPTIGFEFQLITPDGEQRWAQVQGSGGLVGAGCLAAFDGLDKRQQKHAMTRLLDRVMTMVERMHELYVLVDENLEPGLRCQRLDVAEVLDVRQLHSVREVTP